MSFHLGRRRGYLGIIVGLVFAGYGRADEWPVKRGPSNEPAPYRYDAKAWKQVPREFLEDYSACTLYYANINLIAADGTVETITHDITRLSGRKGIEALGEYRGISYDPSWQTLILNEARVLKADGSIVPIDPQHVHLRDVSTDYQVYDRDKQLVISFPNLAVGDCYEVKWTVRGKNPEFGGRFFARATFGDDQYPVMREELVMRLPKDMPLHHATVNGKVDTEDKEQKGQRLVRWWKTNCPPLSQDADRPSKETLRLQVMVSTFASWDDVGRWKEKLRAECWKCSQDVRDLVKKLTANLKTQEEKARALTNWVKRSVRYISISSAGSGYTPRLPHQVFASRFGDCKDQAQLLAVMLKEAGLDVSLVTLGALDDGQVVREVPSPWGTHGILLVTIDGKEHWIDTTASLAGWDFLPRGDRDRTVYVTQDGNLRLLKTPALTFKDNRIVQVTHVAVQPDGSTLNRRALTCLGLSALSRRESWMEVPPGERRRLMVAELQDSNSRSRLVGLNIDDKALAKLDEPVTADLRYRIPGQFSGDASAREGSVSDSNVWNRILGYSFDPDRKTPLHLGTPFESVHRYIVELPLGYRFDTLPRDRDVASAFGSFEIQVKHDEKTPRRLEITFHTRLEKVQVNPGDFAAFQKFHEEVSRHWRVWLYMKATQDLADAAGLEMLQRMTGGLDMDNAVSLAKLFQHHGKWEEAGRVLRQSLLFHSQEQTLWDLLAKGAGTPQEEEEIYQDMVRIFPTELKYAVALGAARVKRGDHAGALKTLLPLTGRDDAAIRAQAQYHLAQNALAQRQAAAALKHLQAAAVDDAELIASAPALRFKAQAHELLGQREEALAAYREALKDETEADATLIALVRLELADGRRREALDWLRRLAVRAKERPALLKAGELYFQLGHHEDALELAHRARDLGFSTQTQRLLGLVYFEQGDYEKTIFHLDRADQDSETLERLIHSHLAQGQLQEALRHGKTAFGMQNASLGLRQATMKLMDLARRGDELLRQIKAPKEKAQAALRALEAYVCAEHFHREGKPADQVAKLLDVVFAQEIPIGPAFSLRGLLALDKGRLKDALADGERAASLSPRHAAGFYVRGRARLERGDYGALGDLIRAADLTRHQDGLILHWLAAAQLHIGQPADALATQRLAATLLPRDPDAQRQLRELESSSR